MDDYDTYMLQYKVDLIARTLMHSTENYGHLFNAKRVDVLIAAPIEIPKPRYGDDKWNFICIVDKNADYIYGMVSNIVREEFDLETNANVLRDDPYVWMQYAPPVSSKQAQAGAFLYETMFNYRLCYKDDRLLIKVSL